MKLWQKIFIPSAVLTMLGIFAISLSMIVRSHTIQLESQKDAILSKSNEVISELQQTVEDERIGHFVSSSDMDELLLKLSMQTSGDDTTVSILLSKTEQLTDEVECYSFSKTSGNIHYRTIIFLYGNVYKVSISKNIQPLLNQFQEEIRTTQMAGIGISLIISVALLLWTIVITRPIGSLKKATENIASGDYSYRITYNGTDEFAELSQYMNKMAAHIETDTAYIEGISENRRKFIANMTHELKTPLTSILGFADVLRVKPDVSEDERRNYADIIFAEANRLKMLSSRLMELITINEVELHMSTVDVAKLLVREAEMYRPICEEAGVTLATDLEPAIIQADEILLSTMIVNLIDNARKASAPGKEIIVRCKRSTHHVLIQFIDFGIGIPQEQLAYVTDAFYMVDKARTRKAGGAGIGLALCKAIATAHHGELNIESNLNEGTTVSVSVPLYERSE